MESTSNNSCTRNPKCNGTIFLLLFVGFIIGFSVGFSSKDAILTSVTARIVDANQPPDERINQNRSAIQSSEEPEAPAETQPTEGESPSDEEKTETPQEAASE